MTQSTSCIDVPSDAILNDRPVDQSTTSKIASQPCPTTAFAPPPPPPSSVPRCSTVQSSAASSASHPAISRATARECEGCRRMHGGTYGSGRFCGATCAKKVGARHKWAARASTTPASRRLSASLRANPTIPASSNASAAVTSTAPTHMVVAIPCESCHKLHDKSYGSGRFCSVHCARRVAATRKWEKSRSEKSKRLDAIRPAMIASPLSHHHSQILHTSPSNTSHLDHHHHHHHYEHHQQQHQQQQGVNCTNSSSTVQLNSTNHTSLLDAQPVVHANVPASASVLAGKRRRLSRQIDRVHVALQHAGVPSPSIAQRFDVPSTAANTTNTIANDIAMVAPSTGMSSAPYLPHTVPLSSFPSTTHSHPSTPLPPPMYPSVHPLLAQRTRAFSFPSSALHPGMPLNTSHSLSSAPNPTPVTHVAYAYPYAPVPAYTAMHTTPHSVSDSMFAAFSPISAHSSAPASLPSNSPAASAAFAANAPPMLAPMSTPLQLQQHHNLQFHQLQHPLQHYHYAQFACAAQRATAIPATYGVPATHAVAYDMDLIDPMVQVSSSSSSSTPLTTIPGPSATVTTSASDVKGKNGTIALSTSTKRSLSPMQATRSSQTPSARSVVRMTCRSEALASDRPAIENSETAARALLCLRSTNS